VNSVVTITFMSAMLPSHITSRKGGARHFHLGGATGGASFATRGTVNGLCRTFRKRPTPPL